MNSLVVSRRCVTFVIGMLSLGMFAQPAAPTTQLAAAVVSDETPAQHDARMQWWREARFGLFIHWGIYSIPAGMWHDKQVPKLGEWIMNNGRIPVADYAAFASQFNPVKYD